MAGTKPTTSKPEALRTLLTADPLYAVDLETLLCIEQSRDVDSFLDPTAPKVLYGLFQNHIKSNPKGGIFDDRYGLACVRILIRLAQILVCAKTIRSSQKLEYVKLKIHGASSDDEVVDFLTRHTTTLAMDQTPNVISYLTISGLFGDSEDLFDHENTCEMLDAFYRGRKLFFKLYKEGSLQGIMLLLYVVWSQTNGMASSVKPFMLVRLRDLLLRVYLVTSTEERNNIRLMCIQLYKVYDAHMDVSEPIDLEDSRAVVHAYHHCIMSPTDPNPMSGLLLDVYRYHLEFVSDLISSLTPDELVLVVEAATERLWLAFDTEKFKPILGPDDPRSQVLYYAGDLVHAVGQILEQFPSECSPTPLVKAFAVYRWPDLMARYMLLAYRKPVATELPSFMFNEFSKITSLLYTKFGNIASDTFVDTFTDWIKIHSHLRILCGWRECYDASHAQLSRVVDEWARWGQVVGFGAGWRYKTNCAYPRCPGGLSTRLCKKCDEAQYCSLKCQNNDNLSSFPDSHKKCCEL